MTKKVLVVAGEISGDQRAASVVRKIKEINPHVEFFGMGSDKLKEQGMEVIIDPTDLNSIGFLEAIKNYKTYKEYYNVIKDLAIKREPDIFFLTDYSAFNMKMAKLGYKLDIPVVDYFPPSAWLWGEWRAKKMAKYNTIIASNLPMERDVYIKNGAETVFVGHPLIDEIKVKKSKTELRDFFEIKKGQKVVGLLPGSRKSEIEKLLPVILKAAENINKTRDNITFLLPSVSKKFNNIIESMAYKHKIILKIINNHNHEVIKCSDFIITASGTATLEAMILSTPMLIVYKTSNITYRIAKWLVYYDHMGMPNLLAKKRIVPELKQNEVTVENIVKESNYILNKPYLITDIKIKLVSLTEKLGSGGAVKKTAELIMKEGNIDVLKR
ncbi:MAG: lipid-A-disaccharide synthase [Halanaerobiales bacterium]|nr:lipid-A-disaccharide synthase [Halanaerobiales bacterium]